MKSATLLLATAMLIAGLVSGGVRAASVRTEKAGPLGITGGKEVTPHSYPFMAALDIDSSSHGFDCGGTLITSKVVLTAAHCFDNNPTQIVVYLGRHDISINESSSQKMTSTKYTVHSGWNNKTLANDIALVTLPEAAILNDYVKLITIDTSTDSLAGQTGTIVGWGVTENGTQSPQLRSVDAEIITEAECHAQFSEAISTNICTSGDGAKGGCTGDSGGPLLANEKQVGIMSFGSGDCTDGLPSAFTWLSRYNDWLNKNVGDTSIFAS